MAQESFKQPKEAQLLKQLIGEWLVGIAMKTPDEKVVSGCGEMTAVETESGINSEINTEIEDYEDYYENDLWSYDPTKDEVHLFRTTSERPNPRPHWKMERPHHTRANVAWNLRRPRTGKTHHRQMGNQRPD